jgi:streptomycin 6-kinase
MSKFIIPYFLHRACSRSESGTNWLHHLPNNLCTLQERWSLKIDEPIVENASCSWVAPCTREDGSPAIFKLGMPHSQAEGEIAGLLFWDGDPTVFLFAVDREMNAMLLERCFPGTSLNALTETEQDPIVAGILRRLWAKAPDRDRFRSLPQMVREWTSGPTGTPEPEYDYGFCKEGDLLRTALAEEATEEFMLATDLHAGNILRAERECWLAIDPKPYYGDPAYDATQHLLNGKERLANNPGQTIFRFAELLELDGKRVQRWLFARLASESHISDQNLARNIGLP